ncbi:MAG: hypothetical protein HKN39_01700 [Flavobacteriales bacterium]|nr:hypothetical protein [Flavobacteriales bacterium]
MNSATKIVLLVAVAIGLVLLINYFSGPKHSWGENYRTNNTEPFGLEFTLKYVKGLYPEKEFIIPDTSISATLEQWTDTVTSNYLHIGGYLHLDTLERSNLFDYVASGNNAIFILERPNHALMESLNDGSCNYYWDGMGSKFDTIWKANFVHPELNNTEGVSFMAVNSNGPIKRYWNYFPEQYFCLDNTSYTKLGTANDTLVNFIRKPHGNGFFYIHSNPILFTNYFVTQKEGADYVRDVFSHMNDGAIIYEDLVYQEEFDLLGDDNRSRDTLDRNEGPFRYIMSQESLRWAMYTLLGLLAIYVFFGVRRKQKMIPVALIPENSSIEYVETISELYYQLKGRNKIAQYLFDQYYAFIREHYQLSPGEDRKKFLEKLSLKSDVLEGHLKALEELNEQQIHRTDVTQDDLIQYYKKLEQFYESCT